MMSAHPLDHPTILNNLFYPRSATMRDEPIPKQFDGHIPINEEIRLGYRFYVHKADSPVILYFHGNGEVARDYDIMGEVYGEIGMSLLVVDYRGYGWSSGSPLTSKLLPDSKLVAEYLPTIHSQSGVKASVPLFIKGRSLGSAPAIYLGMVMGDRFRGLMLDSPYTDAPSLFRRLGIPLPDDLPDADDLPIFNDQKIARVKLPLLILHGEADSLIPVTHAHRLYDASPVADKTLIVIPNAGHNDLSWVGQKTYFPAVADFVGRLV